MHCQTYYVRLIEIFFYIGVVKVSNITGSATTFSHFESILIFTIHLVGLRKPSYRNVSKSYSLVPNIRPAQINDPMGIFS